MLDRAIAAGTASPSRLGAVGSFLAQFYQTQSRIALQPHEYVDRVAAQIRTDEHALLAPELQLNSDCVWASVGQRSWLGTFATLPS